MTPPQLDGPAHPPSRPRPGAHAVGILGIWALAWAPLPAQDTSFQESFAAISPNAAAESENSILELIQSGTEANAAPQAASLAKDWLRQNVPDNPATLYHAARASELAGDPEGAVALYQQFLRRAEPAAPGVSDAITAVHTLLIDYLSQADSAYSFARANAARLAANPTFRQWDSWFLAEARRRGDPEALADRLVATIGAKAPADLIIALHDESLTWLLDHIRSRRYDIPDHRIGDSLLTTTRSLAAALQPVDPEYALLLDVTVSIRAYNMARIDGVETAPPVADAKALLDRYPHHALRIQTEWAGGSTSPHYRDDPSKYFPHQAEQKLAPVLAALPKLDPAAQTRLIESWSPGHYERGPEIMPVESLRDFVLNNAPLINHKAGPRLNLGWDKLSLEEAGQLAPVLDKNPSTDAALIYAILAAGEEKDLGKAIDAVLGSHSWRLTPTDLDGVLADRLWHYTGRPGGNERRDQEIARSKQIAEAAKGAAVPADAPANTRLQAVRQLLRDYNASPPKNPAALWRLRQAISVTPEVVPELLRDSSPLARMLLQDAIATGFTGPDGKRLEDSETWSLEPVLRAALAEQLEKSDLDPWLAAAWLQRTFPPATDPDAPDAPLEFFTKLAASPKWAALPSAVHRAARSVFPEAALTPAQLAHVRAADPQLLCQPLLELAENADAATVADALQTTLANLEASPVRRDIIGLEKLDSADPALLADPQVMPHLLAIAYPFRSFNPPQNYGQRLFTILREERDPAALTRSAAYLWRHVEIQMRDYPTMVSFIGTLADDQPSTLVPLAAWMRHTIARYTRGHSYFNRDDIPVVDALRGRALTTLGLITIPVPPTHPHYPLYQAQAEWVIGNEDSAWKSLDENWDTFIEAHRSLSIDFLMWALDLALLSGDHGRQETLLTSMVTWAGEANSPFSVDEKARVEIALGDGALQRGQVTQAEEIFTRVQQDEAYQESPVRNVAALRRTRAKLAAKDHDGALELIADLESQRIPGLWAPLRLARAEVFFDMERYADAGDDVRSVLQREPENADALLLLGQVQIKNRRYIEASSLEIGAATESPYLVPGENLKVTLNDPGLAISGSGIDIEVVVWTSSDDRETFFLRRFGDEKTRFRGEIPTALGSPAADDGTLQVIGEDEVFYAYSEDFRRRLNLEEEMRGGPITVASDAMLMASARQLLTASEQRIADLEAGLSTREAVNLEDLDAATRARLAAQAADAAPPSVSQATVVKPGNPVHVRVIDPDRSRTSSPDELIVSAATSSGDSIARFVLRETGPHTGWFEGSIPTGPAPPVAFSPHSEPGRNPNSVISPRDDYPAWRPLVGEGETPMLTIDLNDNAPLGTLTITAAEAGAALKTFALQTGMNEQELSTVAVYPHHQAAVEKPFHPSVVVINDTDYHHNRDERSVYDLDEIREHMERGWMTQTYAAGAAGNVAGPSEAMDESIPAQVEWRRQNQHHNSHVIYRFRGYFYEPKEVTRRFKVELGPYQVPEGTHPSVAHPPQFLLAVDGRPITDPENPARLEGEVNLRPGIHHFEIWATGWDVTIGFGRSVRLLANLEQPETLVDCPDAFFDPANFPEDIRHHRNAPAQITANGSGDTFTVTFAPDSQARLIRILVPAYEGAAPAINRVTLLSPDSTQILPTAQDYAVLRQNEILEILPDDNVSVRYADDRPVTRGRDQHERFLRVAFTDAALEFADIEPRFDEEQGKAKPFYERLLRFRHGEPLSIVLRDGDMDSTPEPDTVTLTLAAGGGTPRDFIATETGNSTGVFRLLVTPTPDAPAAPEEFQIAAGGTLTVTYLDGENTRPGIPTERVATIGHAEYATPVIHLAHATVSPLPAEEARDLPLTHGFNPLSNEAGGGQRTTELVRTRWQVDHQWQAASGVPGSAAEAVHGLPLALKIEAPHLALRSSSAITLYAQTSSGRAAAGPSDAPFDIDVPGTIEVEAALRGRHGHISVHHPRARFPTLPIYQARSLAEAETVDNTTDFIAIIPLIADSLPPYGVVSEEEREAMVREAADSRSFVAPSTNRNALVVRPGDTVYLGIQSTDPAGNVSWLTAAATVITHPAFDIMEDDSIAPKAAAYVGESLNLRVIDLGADLTDAPDTVEILLQAKSGARTRLELRETGPHTGVFTARPTLGYTAQGGELAEGHDIRQLGFPVTYGDTVAARYTDAKGIKTDIATVTISKGADGALTPFSKVYDDEETAMRTQFSLAEAYLELSRRYRQLGEITLSDQNATTARQLLASVADQFTAADTRAHAEYLLGQLTLQEALATEDPATKELRFRAALSRFMTVTGSFPDTLHASNAQYRIATIYEALGENDVAAQEYVKLAYKYPQSEFLATSMARLGSHFLRRAADYEEQSKTLLAQAEASQDLDAEHQGTAMAKMAEREYLNTARIFSRLNERFPAHELAAQAGIRAGQAYMRAGHHRDAVDSFLLVANNPSYDGPDIRAQAMYWAGMNYISLREQMAAFAIFQRVTYDFPESEWAAFSRAQLSEEGMLRLETQLELQRLEEGQ